MKHNNQRVITALLAAVLVLTLVFSACNSLVEPPDIDNISSTVEAGLPGGEDKSIGQSDGSVDNSNELNTAISTEDTQSDSSEANKDSEKNKPSTLIPILELGIGDGDYEVGYIESDWAAPLLAGPEYFDVYENEILIGDSINKRLLLYSEGKLIDKVDVSEYHWEACTLDDAYYYIISVYHNSLLKIDRKTKTVSPIKISIANAYFEGFFRNGNDILIQINEYDGDITYRKITGDAVETESDFIRVEIYVDKATGVSMLKKNGKNVNLKFDAIANASSLLLPVDIEGRYAKQRVYVGGKFYTAYFKIDESGECEGIYVSDSELQSLTGNFEEKVDDDGNLLVVYKSVDKVGIYKVVFGMDIIPQKERNEIVRTSSTILSTSDVPHPNVSQSVAEARAKQIINLQWTLTQANKPANQTHLTIPPHIANSNAGDTITSIPYCIGGSNGLESMTGGYTNSGSFLNAVNAGRPAGNVSGYIYQNAAGLDCSGFASSVYGYTTKYFADTLRTAGKNVGYCCDYNNLNDVLDEMDMIVQMNDPQNPATSKHVLVFIEQIGATVKFYNATTKFGRKDNEDDFNRAVEYSINKSVLDNMGERITLHKMWECDYTYLHYNDSEHFYVCRICDNIRTEPHTMECNAINATYHRHECECGYHWDEGHSYTPTYVNMSTHRQYCSDCGYSMDQAHTVGQTYDYNDTYHMKYCTECGGLALRAKHLMQNGVCTICGYSTNIMAVEKDPEETATPVGQE